MNNIQNIVNNETIINEEIQDALNILKEDIAKKQKTFDIIKSINFNELNLINEDTWHELCKTSLRNSHILEVICKRIFPDAQNIECGANYVYFTLYGFACQIPTSSKKCIEVDTSWYEYDYGLKTFYGYSKNEGHSHFHSHLQQIETYLKIEKPTLLQRLSFVFDTKVKIYPLWKKLLMVLFHYKIYKTAINKDRLIKEYNSAKKDYQQYVDNYNKTRQNMKNLSNEMKNKLIPELMTFSKEINAIKPNYYYSPEGIFNLEKMN